MAQQLPPDPQPYGSVQHPVTLDMWSYIVEVGWPGGWALVEMPTTDASFAPLGCYLKPLDLQGDALFPGNPNETFWPTGDFYTRNQLIPKNDYAAPFLTTTAVLPGGTALTSLASIGGPHVAEALRVGVSYFITGPGIPPKTFFTFDGVNGGILSAPPTTPPSPVPVTVQISNWVFQPLNLDLTWVDPPIFWVYSNWGLTDQENSGYWGGTQPAGFPLERFDAIADTEDISGGVVDENDWFGPRVSTDSFRPTFFIGGPDQVDFFFSGNWFTHDDTVLGPRSHLSPKFGPTKINWNRSFYILTYFGLTNTTTNYKGWHLQSSVAPYTLSGPNSGDPGYPAVADYPVDGNIFIWQVKFPTAAWSYQYLVNMSKVKEVAIMQLATTFRSRGTIADAVDLDARFPGYPRTHGVSVRMFSGSTRFFIDMTGRVIPVRVDPVNGTTTPANERWSHIYAPLASQLGRDSELGRFDKAGPTVPPPPGFP